MVKKTTGKARERLKKRRGNVLFIECPADGLKEWLAARGEMNHRTMAGEALSILEAARRADQPAPEPA